MHRRDHWDRVYSSKGDDVSWFEASPEPSLAMLDAAGVTSAACVIDIGGGNSRLVDHLIQRGFRCLAVLDVSAAALGRAQARLQDSATIPTWITSDVTGDWAVKPMDVWHDRAVFHFLTDPIDRERYVEHLRHTLRPGGTIILATFAPDGPERCSGLPTSRYSPEGLARELGPEFRLLEGIRHEHKTPSGAVQPFTYARFVRVASAAPILTGKDAEAPSVFSPLTVLREAMRQKGLTSLGVPAVCLLDPDGDIVRWLKRTGRGTLSQTWACYHSELYEFTLGGRAVGVVGCAVGAPYAVLVAEQLFACGCELLVSVTSSGQITKAAAPPYFVLVTHALRDEGTSYHYQPVARYAEADPALLEAARAALRAAAVPVLEGACWTTDAPYRETAAAVSSAEREGILAVEMESAALYAFAAATGNPVVCFAHVTNTMGQGDREFEKGHDEGVGESLRLVEALLAMQGPIAGRDRRIPRLRAAERPER